MAPAVPATPRPEVPVAVPAAVPLPPAAVPPAAVVPALAAANAAATIPVGSLQTPLAAPPVQAPAPPAPSAGGFAAAPAPVVAGEGGNAWQLVPEPVVEARPVEAPAVEAAAGPAAVVPGVPAVEVRMPEVDLSRDAAAVFAAARQASSGETVRPDAPDRRQVVLVTPARVTMLHSCPAAGSLAPQELTAAERIAPAATSRNVAVIAYTDLDPMSAEIQAAIPFFDLLKRLGHLGHAVWIFEGHVSAMAAGCQDADVLIVDDGMMPYLPGNWRSVATRSMRGSEIHVFERKTGALRRLG